MTASSLQDLLSDVLAEAERGGGAVIPPGAEAVIRRSRQLLRHQQLHVESAVSHQQLMGFVLENNDTKTIIYFIPRKEFFSSSVISYLLEVRALQPEE